MLQVICILRCYAGYRYATGTVQRVIGGTMNFGAMAVSRSFNAYLQFQLSTRTGT